MNTTLPLNNIPTEEQNYLCAHWTETRRALQILGRLLDDSEADLAIHRIATDGEQAVRKLQKGQPSRKRPLLSHGPHEGHR